MHLLGFDVQAFLIAFGLWAAAVIIFAESSIVFFLPGDSFLFAAGLVASQGYINIYLLIIICIIAAILGNNFGYFLGRKLGERFFSRDRGFLFKKEYVTKAQHYYESYGALTIVMARYIPIVRTFAPIVAGIVKMNYSAFLFFNFVGSLLWVISLCLLGYFLGRAVPDIEKYVVLIAGIIVLISISPGIVALIRAKKRPKNAT